VFFCAWVLDHSLVIGNWASVISNNSFQIPFANQVSSRYLSPMTTQSTRPIKYAQLEWRNEQEESFEQWQEGCRAFQKGSDGPFTGRAVDLYDNGAVSLEGEFREGLAHGEEIWFFENGNRNSLVTYNDGQRNGPHQVWYETGELQINVHYTQGRRDGVHTVFYESGQKRSEADFKNDQLNGAYTTWFEDGSTRSERIFEAGTELKRREWNAKGDQKPLKTWNTDGTPRSA
jgi:antitoxin component YwqK of YwqJK toxin-antitoxin module